MTSDVDEILQLFEKHGAGLYADEPMTHLEHALQCARLAEEADSPPELVVACLLHDLGHMLALRSPQAPSTAAESVHPFLAARYLSELYPAAVLDPVRLHADARRYLCRAEAGYEDALSPSARRSLARQGGAFDEAGAQVFLRERYCEDAVLLCRFDDLARMPGAKTPTLRHYLPLMRACSLEEPALACSRK